MGQFSTTDLAKFLGISRQAVLKKIQSGEIKAQKVGRSFVIQEEDLPIAVSSKLNETEKKKLDEAVAKTVKEYGETLRLLGKE